MGYPVFYSDLQSRHILDNHPTAIQQVTHLFGSNAYHDGKLNRPFISAQAFQNAALRQQLNAIAHPLVRQAFDTWKIEQKNRIVFNEAAILFETGSYKSFNFTILVTAPEVLRIKRTIERDGTTAEKIKERMAAQWNDDEKSALASFTIHN